MSLLRQRATEVSVLSTLRALSPALARLRLVSAMRSRSEPGPIVEAPAASLGVGASVARRTRATTAQIALDRTAAAGAVSLARGRPNERTRCVVEFMVMPPWQGWHRATPSRYCPNLRRTPAGPL